MATAVARSRRAPPPVFEVEGLCIDYTTELGVLHAVRDVSLAVHEHESFGLVGESGSGKSTLAMGAIRYLAAERSRHRRQRAPQRRRAARPLAQGAARALGLAASASSTRAR